MIQIDGDFYINRNGVVLNNGVPVNILKDKAGYKYFYLYINGKRWQKYLAKIVATYLVSNPMSYKYILFLDGDKSNCSPENIKWISNKQDASKRNVYEKWRGKKLNYTKEYAIKNCTCLILQKYYKTGDLTIINKEVDNIFRNVSPQVQRTMGWSYIYLLDRLERNSLFIDLKSCFLGNYKRFEKGELNNVTIRILCNQVERLG